MMKNYDQSVEINHKSNWPYISNVLLNLIKISDQILTKLFICPFESKYQLLISKREKVEIKKLKNLKALIDYSQAIDDVYENLADMESNKKLSHIVTELFLRGRKLNISLAFISQSYLKVPRTIRLNATHYFIMKIPNKRELHQIA